MRLVVPVLIGQIPLAAWVLKGFGVGQTIAAFCVMALSVVIAWRWQ